MGKRKIHIFCQTNTHFHFIDADIENQNETDVVPDKALRDVISSMDVEIDSMASDCDQTRKTQIKL